MATTPTTTKQVSAKTQAANPTLYKPSQVSPSMAGGTQARTQTTTATLNAPTTMPAAKPSVNATPVNRYNAGGGVIDPYGTQKVTNVPPSVNAAAIGTTPAFTVPPTVPQTGSQGMNDFITSVNNGVKSVADLNEQRTFELQKQKDSGQSDIVTAMKQLGQETQLRNQEYADTGVDTSRQKVDELSSQIEAEQLAVRRQVDELKKNNTQGLFGGALQDEVNRLERDSASKQADLAIVQSATLRKYSTMKDIADRKVDAYLQPIKTNLEISKLFYEENKENLTKEQDRIYQEKIKADDRKYAKLESEAKALSDTKVEAMKMAVPQGASPDIIKAIQSADSMLGVITAAGKYGGDILAQAIKRQTIAKNNLEMEKLAVDIKKTKGEITAPTVPGSQTGTVQTLLNSAKYDKFADQATKEKIAKSGLVIDQLGDLQATIARQNSTGFITGRTNKLLSIVGLNADAGLVQAQLTALVPQLAKGTYGEVGVLTNADTANYRNTLPNLTSDRDKNDLVTAMTLNVVGKSLKNTLETEAANGVNVSGNIQKYNEIMAKKSEIEDRIGVTKNKLFAIGAANPQYQPMIKEMLATGAKPSEILTALGANN